MTLKRPMAIAQTYRSRAGAGDLARAAPGRPRAPRSPRGDNLVEVAWTERSGPTRRRAGPVPRTGPPDPVLAGRPGPGGAPGVRGQPGTGGVGAGVRPGRRSPAHAGPGRHRLGHRSHPGGRRQGLGSPAGHALLVSLAVGAGAYALSLLRSPLEDLLSAHSSAVMTSDLQRRLTRAVSAPAGVEHLEDPEVLDRLSSATGELSSARPGDAPMTLAGVPRRPVRRVAGLCRAGQFPVVGRSDVPRRLVRRPPAPAVVAGQSGHPGAPGDAGSAPQLVLPGVAPGSRSSPRRCASSARPVGARAATARSGWKGWSASWAEARHFERRAMLLSAVVCAMYVIGAGEVGLAAYRGEVGLRTGHGDVAHVRAGRAGGRGERRRRGPRADAERRCLTSTGSPTSLHAPAWPPARASRPAAGPVPSSASKPSTSATPGPTLPALSGLDLYLHAGRSLGHRRCQRRRQDDSRDPSGPAAGAHGRPYHRRRRCRWPTSTPVPGSARWPWSTRTSPATR